MHKIPQQEQEQEENEWREARDNSGRPYYYNTTSNETTWDKPESLWTAREKALKAQGWTQHYTEDGVAYWYNSTSQESVWEEPEPKPEPQVNIEPVKPRSPPRALGVRSDSIQGESTKKSEYTANGANSTTDRAKLPAQQTRLSREEIRDRYFALFQRLGMSGKSYSDLARAAVSTVNPEPDFWLLDSALAKKRLLEEWEKIQQHIAWRTETLGPYNRTQSLRKAYAAQLELPSAETKAALDTTLDRFEAASGTEDEKLYAKYLAQGDAAIATKARVARHTEDVAAKLRDRTQAWLRGCEVGELGSLETLERLRDDVVAQAGNDDVDWSTLFGVAVDVYTEAVGAKASDAHEAAQSMVKSARVSRQRLRKRIRDLLADGTIDHRTEFAVAAPLLRQYIIDVAGNPGSSPVDLYIEAIDEEETSLRVQTGVAMEILAASDESILNQTLEEFIRSVGSDMRIKEPRKVYEYAVAQARAQSMAFSRASKRGTLNEETFHKTPALEY